MDQQAASSDSNPFDRAMIALVVLTMTFGLQMIRAFLAYLQPVLGERFELPPPMIAGLAAIVFGSSFLLALLNKYLGFRRLFKLTTGGLGLTRLALQLWPGDPMADFWLAAFGVALFAIFLPLPILLIRSDIRFGPASARLLAIAFWLGLAIDTALHGFFWTYDYIWQSDFTAAALAVGLWLVQILLLYHSLTKGALVAPAKSILTDRSVSATLPWLAIGPALFLIFMLFQNVARLTTLTGWSLPVAFGWVMLAQFLGIILALWWQPAGPLTEGLIGLLLILALLPPWMESPLLVPLSLVISLITLSRLLTVLFIRLTETDPLPGLKRLTLIHGLSMMLLVGLIFAYYAAYTMTVPYQNSWLLPLAGLIILICAVQSARQVTYPSQQRPFERKLLVGFAAICLVAPLLASVGWPRSSAAAKSDHVRVMTYNIHNGFDVRGRLDLEALAKAIEAQQADIICLQEVSRGWLVNGSLDMVSWLARRLDMPYVFSASSGPLWGNVVFSRYPITHSENHRLPPADLPLQRAFAYHQLELGEGRTLSLINTHFHHGQKEINASIRQLQAETIIQFLSDRTLSDVVLVGDLNTQPDTAPLKRLLEFGLRDAVALTPGAPTYTYPANNPTIRLDYILTSPTLKMREMIVPLSTASDHLGVVVTLE